MFVEFATPPVGIDKTHRSLAAGGWYSSPTAEREEGPPVRRAGGFESETEPEPIAAAPLPLPGLAIIACIGLSCLMSRKLGYPSRSP